MKAKAIAQAQALLDKVLQHDPALRTRLPDPPTVIDLEFPGPLEAAFIFELGRCTALIGNGVPDLRKEYEEE